MRVVIPLCAALILSGSAASAAAAKASDPCRLVTKQRLSTILNTKVTKSSLAPLGPTCVYRFRGTKDELTITVERRALIGVKAEMSGRRAVTVRGRLGYCGRVGEPTLDVSLSHSKFLSIAGSELSEAHRCRAAREMAAEALRLRQMQS
jgi:hypothetical protein